MKKLLVLSALLTIIGVQANVPIEVLTPVESIYIPRGFDSNDNAEVIISGFLPNLCHKSPMSKFTVKGDTIHISISALKYEESSPFCPEMVVPFLERVSLGVLPTGLYNLQVNSNSIYEKKSRMKIIEADSSKMDEHIYANVHNIITEQGSDTVTLSGYTPSDCYVLDKVEFVSNGTNTYSVMPIMKQVSQFCPRKMVQFSKEVKIPHDLKRKQVLLHVRVMNGKSLNAIHSK